MFTLRSFLQKAGVPELGGCFGWEILPSMESEGTVGAVEQVPAGVDRTVWFTRKAIEAIAEQTDESKRPTVSAQLFDELFA